MVTNISVRITKIPFFSSFNAVGAIYYTNDRQNATNSTIPSGEGML